MLKVVWNIVKYFLGIFQNLVYPLKRVICRRRKLSTSDAVELTSIGTGDGLHMTNSVSGSLPQNVADLDMEPWDSWGGNENQQQQNNHYGTLPAGGGRENSYSYQEKTSANGQATRKVSGSGTYGHHVQHNDMKPEPEPEMDMNFFEDMTPSVRKQRKFLIRKKDAMESSGVSNRLAVMSNVPIQTSELESWEDSGNAWEDNAEAAEDMTWQAEEAIREKKKKERLERQMEQQRKKQRKEEMRGIKGGNLAATKLS